MDCLQKKVHYDDSEERGYTNLAEDRYYDQEGGYAENDEDEVI